MKSSICSFSRENKVYNAENTLSNLIFSFNSDMIITIMVMRETVTWSIGHQRAGEGGRPAFDDR